MREKKESMRDGRGVDVAHRPPPKRKRKTTTDLREKQFIVTPIPHLKNCASTELCLTSSERR